jgi:hypothetical protein
MWSLNFDAIVSMQKKGRWDGPRHARADVAHVDAQGVTAWFSAAPRSACWWGPSIDVAVLV